MPVKSKGLRETQYWEAVMYTTLYAAGFSWTEIERVYGIDRSDARERSKRLVARGFKMPKVGRGIVGRGQYSPPALDPATALATPVFQVWRGRQKPVKIGR